MSKRKLYPDECPAFEVVNDNGPYVRKGAHVEGCGAATFNHVFYGEVHCLHVAVVDSADVLVTMTPEQRAMIARGTARMKIAADGLRPLTPAAEAMLALIERYDAEPGRAS